MLMVMLGGIVTRLAITGAHRRYVKAGLGPYLVVAGVLLVVAGVLLLLRRPATADDNDDDDDDDHGHAAHDDDGHEGSPRVAWLLLAPLVVLVLVAPAPLGSFAVANRTRQPAASAGTAFPLLPAGTTVEMSIREYAERVADRDGASMRDVTVRLVGFVAPGRHGPFALARYQIACCAGDAVASVADVAEWDGPVPSSDTWLAVEGVLEPGRAGATLRPTSFTVIEPPSDPYEE